MIKNNKKGQKIAKIGKKYKKTRQSKQKIKRDLIVKIEEKINIMIQDVNELVKETPFEIELKFTLPIITIQEKRKG